jgi:hypothetical protein
MPRGGRGSSRSPPPRSSATSSHPTHTQPQQPPMQSAQQSRPGMFGGFGSTLVQGMAFGAGSAVAHQAIRSVTGGGSDSQPIEQQQQQYQQQQQPTVKSSLIQMQQQQMCMNEINMLTNCLSGNSDISYCQSYSDMLKECQKRSPL